MRLVLAWVALVGLAMGACAAPPSCGIDEASCPSQTAPEFSELFQNVFHGTCAVAGPSCHGAESRTTKLVLDDEQGAYDKLVPTYARPGEPTCSQVVARVTSTDPSFRMPPAVALDAASACQIARWVEAGARR